VKKAWPTENSEPRALRILLVCEEPLRHLKETQRTLVALQAKHAHLPHTLERVLDEVQRGSVEYEEHNARMTFRPAISPEAASALRTFAARILGIDDAIVH
jgi:hypothetical protein